jgi:hypothetical protein
LNALKDDCNEVSDPLVILPSINNYTDASDLPGNVQRGTFINRTLIQATQSYLVAFEEAAPSDNLYWNFTSKVTTLDRELDPSVPRRQPN